jgi:hypothetical protein
MSSPTLTSTHDLTIDIGEIPILVRTDSPDFAHLLAARYGEFVSADAPHPMMELEIELVDEPGLGIRDSGFGKDKEPVPRLRPSDLGPRTPDPGLQTPDCDEYDQELSVRVEAGRWVMERGDFRAEWDPQCHRGWVRQSANPYAIDGVLRILHSLILAREGGFLVHAASAVRNGRAFVFAGISGAGKTTLARLAPPDVTLLTDEISYVRAGVRSPGSGVRSPRSKMPIANLKSPIINRQSSIATRQSPIENPASPVSRVPNPGPPAPSPQSLAPAFQAFGTPFAGELARIGRKVRAPLATLFLLKQGPENRIEPLREAEAARELLRHVLFFARDEELVRSIFQTVGDFVRRVPVCRLVFTPDAGVWELIK